MQSQKLVIVGSGFAGVWSALGAKRLQHLTGKSDTVEIIVIGPKSTLTIRPRLYEADAASLVHDFSPLFESANIKFIEGTVDTIQPQLRSVHVQLSSGEESTVTYDRLVLAAGSEVVRPSQVSGVLEHCFDIDTVDAAVKFERHLQSLGTVAPSKARDTVVVCGAGFTGIELATELPKRIDFTTTPRIVLLDGADEVGPGLGPGPRPVIKDALQALGVEVHLKSNVAKVDAKGVTLASGQRIEALTAVWTAGLTATPLTKQISGQRDEFSRLYVDESLRVIGSEDVYATGDAAHATADNQGHVALMSCQHANLLGRFSGYNAMADLLQEPTMPYSQPFYTTCLDLGGWGAVASTGWDRKVVGQGEKAKELKIFINQTLIYPPQDLQAAVDAADPAVYDVEGLINQYFAE